MSGAVVDTRADELHEPAALTRAEPGRRGGIPPAVWLLTACHLVLMVVYSVVVPTFRAPDEYMHVDLVLRVANGGGYPEFDGQELAASVLRARNTSPAYVAFAEAVGPTDAVPRAERPSFADLAADVGTGIVNPMPQHPPLYYGLAGGFLAGLDRLLDVGSWPFDRVVSILRLLGVAMVAPLPLLAWAASRRLGHGRPVAVVAAGLVLCVPALTHIGSVVNNDDLLVLLGAVLTVLVVRVLTGDLSWATSVGSGYVLGLALLTKGFALVLVPWLVVAYAVALVPSRRWGDLGRRLGAALLVAFVVGGWWWLRNLVVHGVLLPAVGLRDRVPVEPEVSEFAAGFLDRLLTSVWGSFGWNEAVLPPPLVAAATVVLVAAVVVALRDRRRRAHGVLLLPVAVLAVLLAANAWRAYLKTGVPYASQGRYLFVGLLGVLVVAAAACSVVRPRARRFAPAAALAAAVVLHGSAIAAITARYWTGARLRALLAFSPWPPEAVAAVALSLVLVAGATAWSLRPAAWDVRAGSWR